MKCKIYKVLYNSDEKSFSGRCYFWIIVASMVMSIMPIAFYERKLDFKIIDMVLACIFGIDYLLRWYIADLTLGKGKKSFLLYPFTPLAIVDIVSIVPLVVQVHSGIRLLNVFRIIMFFRYFKLVKLLSRSKEVMTLIKVFKRQQRLLLDLLRIVLGYVLITSFLIYSIEPNTFGTFFNAIYWSTISLTTIGYGDITPITVAGKLIAMISALLGIALITLPASIVLAGYIEEIKGEPEEALNEQDFRKDASFVEKEVDIPSDGSNKQAEWMQNYWSAVDELDT